MAFGPPICAACGSDACVQAHYLYLRRDVCPDDLTVWLCPDCHGRAHGLARQINTSELTCLALAAAKAKDRQMPPSAVGTAAIKAKADKFAARVSPIARELQAEGKGLGLIAAELTRRGIKTRRGGKWAAQSVKNLLARGVG